MTRPHPEAHEERLVQVLGESDDPREAFEASELASCPTCRERLDEVAELGGLLDEVARDERASIARAAEHAGAPGEDRVAEIVARAEREAGGRPGSGAPASLPRPLPHHPPPTSDAGMPLRVWVGLAAAVLIVAAFFWLRSRPDDPGVLLGPGAVELVAPLGEVDGFDSFRWTGELAAGSTFVVRVRDADRPDAGWTESPRLRDHAWTPTSEQRAGWADAIEWEVRVLSAVGEVVESSGRGRAWRASD